jgi:hypothetical protein
MFPIFIRQNQRKTTTKLKPKSIFMYHKLFIIIIPTNYLPITTVAQRTHKSGLDFKDSVFPEEEKDTDFYFLFFTHFSSHWSCSHNTCKMDSRAA